MSKTHPLILIAGFIHDVRALLGPEQSNDNEPPTDFSDSVLFTSTTRYRLYSKTAENRTPGTADSNCAKPCKAYSAPSLPTYPHPGGLPLIRHAIGTDATAAFFGGVYEHGWGAHEVSCCFG